MLFHVTWEFTNATEDERAKSLATFAKWQPPAGVTFLGFYENVDLTGGVAIVETGDAATLARTMAPFVPWMRFRASPILPIEEVTAITAEAMAFRASVG